MGWLRKRGNLVVATSACSIDTGGGGRERGLSGFGEHAIGIVQVDAARDPPHVERALERGRAP
jgi:hypothetical protein